MNKTYKFKTAGCRNPLSWNVTTRCSSNVHVLLSDYFKSIILAIAFLLSGTMQTFSQQQLYIYNQNGDIISMETPSNKVEVELSSCEYFYLAVRYDDIWLAEYYYPQRSSENAISITTTATTYNLSLSCDEDYLTEELPAYSQKFQISDSESSDVVLCWKYDNGTLSIAIHDVSKVKENQEATCRADGHVTYECSLCGETRTEILNSTGHSFGEWQTMEGGRFRTCSHDEEHHIQYDMDATGVNALEITLTDGTKLSYPQTLNPVVSFSDLDLNISFDTDKISTVSKADIKEYNQVWSHNKKGYAQNEDKTYSHACDVAGCTFKYNDLFVKNAEQYYVAEKENDVIKIADMTLNDSEGYDCEANITVSNVSYARDMSNYQWGTLCLPFAINPNAYSDCSFYQLSSVDNVKQEIVLSRIDNQEIAAGTPVIVRRNAAVNGISISVFSEEEGEGVAMSNSIQAGSTAGDFTMVGTLKTSDALADNAYIINNDKFWNVGKLINNGKATSVKVGAFRSYLMANTSSAQARMLSLSIGDDDTTAIDVLNAADNSEAEIYDLNGHRLPDLQKGINIVKRGNKTTKVIIR